MEFNKRIRVVVPPRSKAKPGTSINIRTEFGVFSIKLPKGSKPGEVLRCNIPEYLLKKQNTKIVEPLQLSQPIQEKPTKKRDINIMDIPYEALLLIFSMVECSMIKNPFLDVRYKKSGSSHIKLSSWISPGYYKESGYESICKQDPYSICILPYTLSNLGVVCKLFNQIEKQTWEPLFIHHFRGGIQYKNPKKYNYKKKYYEKVYPLYNKYLMDLDKNNNIDNHRTKYLLGKRNSGICLKFMEKAILDCKIGKSFEIYEILFLRSRWNPHCGWYIERENSQLRFEDIIKSRNFYERDALTHKDIYDTGIKSKNECERIIKSIISL